MISIPILSQFVVRRIYGLYNHEGRTSLTEARLTLGGPSIRLAKLENLFPGLPQEGAPSASPLPQFKPIYTGLPPMPVKETFLRKYFPTLFVKPNGAQIVKLVRPPQQPAHIRENDAMENVLDKLFKDPPSPGGEAPAPSTHILPSPSFYESAGSQPAHIELDSPWIPVAPKAGFFQKYFPTLFGKPKAPKVKKSASAKTQVPGTSPALAPAASKKVKPAAVLGIPAESVFYLCVPVEKEPGRKLELSGVIAQNPRIGFLDSPDFCVDWHTTQVKGKTMVFLGAVKTQSMREFQKKLGEMGFCLLRTEPAPYAALRASVHFCGPLRGEKVEVRCLKGNKAILIALLVGALPMTWRYLDLENLPLKELLLAGIQSVVYYGQHQLHHTGVDRLVFQGFTDEQVEAIQETLGAKYGCPIKNDPNHRYDGFMVSLGLSLGATRAEDTPLNLSKETQSPVPLRYLYPIVETFVATILMAGVLAHLAFLYSGLQDDYQKVLFQNMSSSWANGENKYTLESEKAKLTKEVNPLSKYVAGTTQWSKYLTALPGLLPDNVMVTSMEAFDNFWGKASSSEAGNRYFTIKGLSYFPLGEAVPQAIDQTLSLFLQSPLLHKEMPDVAIKDIVLRKDAHEGIAVFTLLCNHK